MLTEAKGLSMGSAVTDAVEGVGAGVAVDAGAAAAVEGAGVADGALAEVGVDTKPLALLVVAGLKLLAILLGEGEPELGSILITLLPELLLEPPLLVTLFTVS